MSGPLSHRDPYTFRKLPTVEATGLTNAVLTLERLIVERRNADTHQFLHELQQGGKPWHDAKYD